MSWANRIEGDNQPRRCVLQMKEDELERTAVELEECRARLTSLDSGYFPACKVKTLFH